MKTQYLLVYYTSNGEHFFSDEFIEDEDSAIVVKEKWLSGDYNVIEFSIATGRMSLLYTHLIGIEIRSYSYDDDF